MTEPDMSGYSAEELFRIMVIKAKMIGADPASASYTMYGRGSAGGSHSNALTLQGVARKLSAEKQRHAKYLNAVIVYSPKGTNANGDREVVYRSSPEAKAWWE